MASLPLLRVRPGLALIRRDGVEHDLVGLLGGIESVTLAPIVADGVREDVAVLVEVGCRNCAAHVRVPLETVLGVLVPEVEGAVGAGGGEGAMLRVEADGVEAVDVANVAIISGGLAVAFEAEVAAGVLVLDVLDGAAAFDTADCEPLGVCEGLDAACLPLEWRWDRLEEGAWGLQVDDVDVAFGRANDEHVVTRVHGVDALLACECGDRGLLAQVPVFDGLVPGTGDQDLGVVDVAGLDALDSIVVSGDLSRIAGVAAAQVKHAGRLVRSCAKYFLTILYLLSVCCS